MLPEEQLPQIKQQIIQQIESNFPEDKKPSAIEQVNSMGPEELEQFLIQNNLVKTSGEGKNLPPQCIFCSIVSGKVQSQKIDESEEAVAVLEINPISKGHTLIIPKQHIESKDKIPKSILIFAKQIAEKIKAKLNPKDISISSANMFGHEIINILPVYEDETLQSQKHQASPEELEEVLRKINKEVIIEDSEIKTPASEENSRAGGRESSEENLKIPKRIP